MNYPIVQYSGIKNKPWVLVEDFYIELSNGYVALIPKGYWTDFASVPRVLKVVFDHLGKGSPAYVLHDYMYNFGGYKTENGDHRINKRVSRKRADKEMAYQMRKYGESKFKIMKFYTAVRLFGWFGWRTL